MISSINKVPYKQQVHIAYNIFVKGNTRKEEGEKNGIHASIVQEIARKFRGNFRDAVMREWTIDNNRILIAVEKILKECWTYNETEKYFNINHQKLVSSVHRYLEEGICIKKPTFSEEELAAEKFYSWNEDDVNVDFEEGTYLRSVQNKIKKGKIPIYALQNQITGKFAATMHDGNLEMMKFQTAKQAIRYRAKHNLRPDVFCTILYGWEVKK
jgi:hypothetical protein